MLVTTCMRLKGWFVIFVICAVTKCSHSQGYAPVETLNTEAYLGRWFQMYTNLGFILLELGANCVTADYTLREEDGKIALVNQARPFVLFPRILARTTGFVVQGDIEGSFTVDQGYFFPINPDEVEYETPGNYWIIALGPIVDGQYQWAAVSSPDKSNSFILARDVQEFTDMYKDEALAVFEEAGGFENAFTNKPLPTSHFLCFGYP